MDISSYPAVALSFVDSINSGDLEGIASLTARRYKFTDSAGRVYVFDGEEAVKQSWNEYLSAYPEYKIHVQQVLTSGKGVAILGRTSGSHVPPEIERGELVLWVAEFEKGFVSEWRIYSTRPDS